MAPKTSIVILIDGLYAVLRHVSSARYVSSKLTLFEWFIDQMDQIQLGYNFELSHRLSILEDAWQHASKALLGADLSWFEYEAAVDDILPQDAARHRRVLNGLSSMIDEVFWEGEVREYRYGDSDYNPYSLTSCISYAEDCGGAAGRAPARQIKCVPYSPSPVTSKHDDFDDDIPF